MSFRSDISVRTTLKLTLCALVACLALIPQAADAKAPSIKWRGAVSLENPKKAGSFDGVSCAISTVKAATKTTGKARTTTMARATSRAKTTTATAPVKQYCAAIDSTGHIWWSSMPWKDHTYWRRVTIDQVKGASLTGISCPTISFCVVVDDHGDVIYSKDPSGGAKYWSKPLQVDTTGAAGGGPAGFAGISCPTARLCVAVDNASQVVTTTKPTAGASAWTLSALPNGPVLTSVSCPSTTLCVLGGSTRYESTTPTGGVSAWTARGAIVGGVLESLACPAITVCVGVGYGDSTTGLASATGSPSGPTSGWTNLTLQTMVPSGNGQLLDSVACPTVGFCIAVDGADNAFASVSPLTGGWAAIASARKRANSTGSAISCDLKNCVVVDNRGFLISGTVLNAPASTTTATTTTTTTTPTTTTTS